MSRIRACSAGENSACVDHLQEPFRETIRCISNPNHTTIECPTASTLTFDGDYDDVVGEDTDTFLNECSADLAPAHCTNVTSGSILVTVEGMPSQIHLATARVANVGLALPSFPKMADVPFVSSAPTVTPTFQPSARTSILYMMFIVNFHQTLV